MIIREDYKLYLGFSYFIEITSSFTLQETSLSY